MSTSALSIKKVLVGMQSIHRALRKSINILQLTLHQPSQKPTLQVFVLARVQKFIDISTSKISDIHISQYTFAETFKMTLAWPKVVGVARNVA